MANSSLDSEPEDVGDEEVIEGCVDDAVVEILGQLEEGLVVGCAHQPGRMTAEYTTTVCVLRIIIDNAYIWFFLGGEAPCSGPFLNIILFVPASCLLPNIQFISIALESLFVSRKLCSYQN